MDIDQNALQNLLDKQAISELVNRYCRAADRHDNESMRELYFDDATDDHGGFFKGMAMDFIDELPEIQKPMKILHHNVTTHNIELNGDKAEGEVYVLAFHQAEAADGQVMDFLVGGRYLDKYEKRQGVWKFSARAVLADWVHFNEPTKVQLDHPGVTGSLIGKPRQEDPSYEFFDGFAWKS